MQATYGFLKKHIFTWTASQINGIGESGVPRILMYVFHNHSMEKNTLLAASFKSGIIGPIFLQDTVHSNLYAKILREFVAIQNDLELVANKYIVVHTKWCNPSRTPAVFILLEDEYYQ